MGNVKIIVCGWWFDKFDNQENQTDLIDDLIYINSSNSSVEVFWACHKEPIPLVKENFKWKLYDNVGLEWGAYNKAFADLELADEDYIFCLQDDLVINDWEFLDICQQALQTDQTKVIGNGFNYPYNMNPLSEARLSYWLKTSDRWVDYVRSENQDMYDETINCLSIRGSFLATKWKWIKLINGFEYIDLPLKYGMKDDGSKFLLIDPYGNTALYLNAYKMTKYLGVHSFKWLSNNYRKSKWMVECGRGLVELPNDHEVRPFDIPNEFILNG